MAKFQETIELTPSASPVACSLTDAELAQRRETIGRSVMSGKLSTRELARGYAFEFPPDAEWVTTLAQFIAFERDCCPFLTFELICEPDGGPVWLQATGPEGAKDFLQRMAAAGPAEACECCSP